MSVLKITNENFNDEVINSDKPVVVDFYADWCGPCKMIAPIMEELASENDGKFKICKVDVDNAQEIAGKYGIMSIPTLLFFKGGVKVDQITGAVPKSAIEEIIEKL